ncbi:unnamed protein product [Pseudo-nitzschia multistriata]|uniref:Uncharacterized protein n=1 Tax=Pseudo-nitzschia multistriata TaxID=183589 RepID=A0A448ZF44_9STRA|nr:unnamed protein product [Pseudo-nitzschia multistriata]
MVFKLRSTMISAPEMNITITPLLRRSPLEYLDTHPQRLGKKRPRSSLSEDRQRVSNLKTNRKVRFVNLSSSLPLGKSSSQNDANNVTGKSEKCYTDNGRTSAYSSFDHNNVWYSKRELAEFTRQARNYVLGMDQECKNMKHLSCTRGFERYDIARSQQKTMTRNIILLLMQQKTLSDEEKSLIARRSSAWAVEDAFLTGCKDFCEAYHPQMSHLFSNDAKDAASVLRDVHENARKRIKLSIDQNDESCNCRQSRAASVSIL